ncbi:MAG: hypothetical protein ACYC55_06620, partial [Candidatus Geothermincolia bacterium]
KGYGAEFIASHELVDIGDDTITLRDVASGARTTWHADAVVLAVGVKSEDRLVAELKSAFPRVAAVGDARQPGRLYNAVRDGFDTAWDL